MRIGCCCFGSRKELLKKNGAYAQLEKINNNIAVLNKVLEVADKLFKNNENHNANELADKYINPEL